MKKNILAFAAMLSIVFASCVKNEPYIEPEESGLKGKLFINEVNGWPGDDLSKNFELYNGTNETISLDNFYTEYGDREMWRGRAEDVIPAKGYKLIKGAQNGYPGFNTGLSNRNPNISITLFDPDGAVIDYYVKAEDLRNGHPLEFMCHMRIPDGGKWYFVQNTASTPGAANLTNPSDPAVVQAMLPMEKGLKIEEISISATRPTPADDVTIVAKVTDINVVTSVVLKWKLNGADQPEKAMTKNGNDYSATITKQANGAVVDWTVVATNDQGKTVSENGTIKWEVLTTDYTKLKLNEVSGAGGDDDKFYELINTGTADINLAGCQIFYNANGSNGGTLPTGDGNLTWTGIESQVIEAGKLFSLIGRNKPGSFTTGLTAARILIITLKDPAGNVIDQCIRAEDTGKYAIIEQSFSRIPDGTGPFYFTTPSPNVLNGTDAAGLIQVPVEPVPFIDYTKLQLNEVSGVGNDPDKFYELINTGTANINLAGCKIYYNANGSNGGTIPTGDGNLTWTGSESQIIEAGKLFSLIGRNTPGSFTTGLTAARILIITLKDPDDNIIDQCIRAEDTGKYDFSDKSFSRIPDGTGPFYFTTPTPFVFNGTDVTGLVLVPKTQEPPVDYTKLKLNEVSGVGSDDDKFYELINTGAADINLAGCQIFYNANGSNGGTIPTGDGNLTWTGSESQVIEAGKLFSLIGRNKPGSFTTGLTAARILIITLKDPDGKVIDQCIRALDTGDYDFSDKSFSRIPDGTGPFYFTTPTPNVTNGTNTTGLVLVPKTQEPQVDYSKLVVNEVSGNNKYVEIYNSGTMDIPLLGVKLQRNDGPTSGGSEWTGAATDSIKAGAYGLFLFNSYTPADLNTNPALLGTVGSGISSGQILKVAIVDPKGNPISVFIRGDVPLPAWQVTTNVSQNTTDTYSRMADGTWAYAAPTPGAVNGAKTADIVTPGYLTAQP